MIDEVYIRMCREATEIQEEWEPKLGDLSWDYFIFPKGQLRVLEEYEDSLNAKRHEDNFWVPRQEDLQKIYKEQKELSFDCCYVQFKRWDAFRYQHERFEHGLPYFEIFETGDWNILWLCFVMETCFQKKWNGTTWEAI